MNQCNREMEIAEREVTAAQNELALLPAPVAALDDEQRDDLRQTLARQEEIRRQLPSRQRALQEARTMFVRAYGPLRLSGGAHTSHTLDDETCLLYTSRCV